ncbi:MAG: ribosome-associated translation inhibitor RaiA [Firmicutes bacterium]|nr:ribosome-associated translation inhibitor RaiA [Bacillota bacterium]
MKYEFTGRGIEITDQLKEISMKKLDRLDRYFADDTKIFVKYRTENRDAVVEITIPVQGSSPIRSEVRDKDKLTALDLSCDKLERQVVRYRKKLQAKGKTDKTFDSNFFATAPADAEEEVSVIRRVKRVAAKPMDPEEAILQMELLGHDFFVFRNNATQQVCVVYKRTEAGTYGLIETVE